MSSYQTRKSFARAARAEHNRLMSEANDKIEQATADREAKAREAAAQADDQLLASTVPVDPDDLSPGDLVWRHVRGHWREAMVRSVTPAAVTTDTGVRIPRDRPLRKVPDEANFRPGCRP